MRVGGQEKIVGTGFGGDVHAAIAGGDHLCQWFGGADMKYMKRAAGQGSNLGGALHGAGLQSGGTRTFVPDRLAVAGGDSVSTQLIQKRSGFAVQDYFPHRRRLRRAWP